MIKEMLYGNTRCYLINNVIMVDTDWAGTLQKFFHCAKVENIDIKSIEYLIITHFHPDHMGIAQELSQLRIKIIVFDKQMDYIHSSDSIFEKEKSVSYQSISEKGTIKLSCSDSRDFFKSIGVDGEVIYTPGHSEDSVSVILDEGVAIVGDLPPLYTVPAYHDTKLEESWNEVLSHHIHLICYGHAKADSIENVESVKDIVG